MLIFLNGFMGSGKSHCGLILASAIKYDFADTDIMIEDQWGMSINDFFEDKGEPAFRRAEHEVLMQVLSLKNTVVACGGGLPCFNDNMDLMNAAGLSVYLKFSPEALAVRLGGQIDSRPLLKNIRPDSLAEYIRSVLEEREKYYMMSKLIIEGGNENAFMEKLVCNVKKLIP